MMSASRATPNYPNPPGFFCGKLGEDDQSLKNNKDKIIKLKEKRAWGIAKSPVGMELLKNLFMFWMSGSTVNMFSLGLLGLLAFTPVKNIMGVDKIFAPLQEDGVQLTYQKLAYVFANVLLLALPIYKAKSLGLMPSAADFVMNTPAHLQTFLSGGDL